MLASSRKYQHHAHFQMLTLLCKNGRQSTLMSMWMWMVTSILTSTCSGAHRRRRQCRSYPFSLQWGCQDNNKVSRCLSCGCVSASTQQQNNASIHRYVCRRGSLRESARSQVTLAQLCVDVLTRLRRCLLKKWMFYDFAYTFTKAWMKFFC